WEYYIYRFGSVYIYKDIAHTTLIDQYLQHLFEYHIEEIAKMSPFSTLIVILVSSIMIHHLPLASSTQWCVASPTSKEKQLEENLGFACANGVDCRPILEGGACYNPNTPLGHASYVMNAYYATHERTDYACKFFFPNSAMLTTTNPSYGSCVYA
ncbi:major pollen allergen Ole e 10, partial [Brassica napus]|uniref:major pollen allergen Ole e 10 n=1 Tax=Brassica napus TaxID=3708 RepID=UPI0020788442